MSAYRPKAVVTEGLRELRFLANKRQCAPKARITSARRRALSGADGGQPGDRVLLAGGLPVTPRDRRKRQRGTRVFRYIAARAPARAFVRRRNREILSGRHTESVTSRPCPSVEGDMPELDKSLICKGCWSQMHMPIPIRGPLSLPFKLVGITISKMNPRHCQSKLA